MHDDNHSTSKRSGKIIKYYTTSDYAEDIELPYEDCINIIDQINLIALDIKCEINDPDYISIKMKKLTSLAYDYLKDDLNSYRIDLNKKAILALIKFLEEKIKDLPDEQ